MARILSIQSHVVAGHVGLGASTPALTLLGHEVLGLPTVVLSGHAATKGVAGRRADGAEVSALLDGLAVAGVSGTLDAVLTGYLGTVAVANAVADGIATLKGRGSGALYLCDPVLGDAGRLYLPAEMVPVYADRLLPLADVALPNNDELGWITGEVDKATARQRLLHMGPGRVFVTSVGPEGQTGIATFGPDGVAQSLTQRVPGQLHGAGDFVAALILDGLLGGMPDAQNAARAVRVTAALAARAVARGEDTLPVVAERHLWLAEVARGGAYGVPALT